MATETMQKVIITDLVIKRIIDAPVKKVWEAWTVPEKVMCWWGPQDYSSPLARVDLRKGGKFFFVMHAPKEQGGEDSYTVGTYSKIVPMKSLEFTQSFADKDGNVINPQMAGMPADVPAEIQSKVIFKSIHEGKLTALSVMEYCWPVGQLYVYSIAGWHQSIDKLSKCVK
jgi:uncharacterized protein YndB with AHSA1/START domain